MQSGELEESTPSERDGSSARLPQNRQHAVRRRAILLLALCLSILFFSALPTLAQDDSETGPGTDVGNYNIKQSIDIGYRYTNISGSNDVYDTFINLGSGVRLLDQSLDVRSLNHNGILFDDLHFSSLGLGGDPNNVVRLRIDKNKWYEFTGLFRRDKYFWDYNLLANPFNPAGFTQITNSPHNLDLVHRNTDLNLLLLPQSRFQIRVGYTRNVEEGPAYTTSEGESIASDLSAIPELFQNSKTTVNGYHFGFDYKYIPKTVISYDQFFQFIKDDTSAVDNNLTYQLANGTPADLGIVFNPTTPCASPISNPNTTPPTINSACAATLSYTVAGRPRISMPTEQLAFTSSYFHNVEMTGLLNYSSSNLAVNDYNEIFNGSSPRTLARGTSSTGPADAQRISAAANFGITWQVTHKFRIMDTVRYYNWRVPGQWAFGVTGSYASAPLINGAPSLLLPPGVFSTNSCPPPFTANTCPQHSSSSGPDVANGIDTNFLSENDRTNTVLFGYDFTPRYGANIGFVYSYRNIQNLSQTYYDQEIFYPGPEFLPGTTTPASYRGDCAPIATGGLPAGCVPQPNGSVIFSGLTPGSDTARNSIPINQYSLIFGLWARPIDTLRLNYDMAVLSADQSFTRITPRQQQNYRLRGNYKPAAWLNVDSGFNIVERRDNVETVNYLDHNRTYNVTAVVIPNQQFSLQASYNYTDILSLADVCLTVGFASPPGSIPCPSDPTGGLLGTNSVYSNKIRYIYGGVTWKPFKRVSTTFGYSGTFTNGSLLFLNPPTGLPIATNSGPAGPLQYNYHQPWATLNVDIARGISYRASWNYYGYNEKEAPGLIGPRDFNANLATFALHYSF